MIDDNKHADVYEIRPTLTLETPHEPLSAFFEFELAHLGEGEEDWLVQAYADYKIGDEWLIRAGRLYTSASYFTSPSPIDLETARYPREPWGYYAYGIQTEGTIGGDWNIMADITGASDVNFADDANWDRLEFSGHIGKEILDKVVLGFETQLSEDFARFATDFTWEASDHFIVNGEVYTAFEEDGELYGGYVLGRYKITEKVSVHSQADYQHGDEGDGGLILTNGVLLRTSDDRFWFILDYEWDTGEPGNSGLFAVLQFRF